MSKQGRYTLIIGAGLILALLALRGLRPLPDTHATDDSGRNAEALADLAFETLAGEEVVLRELRGKVVLVNFWATWCSGCRAEMPGFQNVYDRFKDDGFTILALSIDEGGPPTVRAFFDEHGYTFPVAMATDDSRRRFGASGVPTSYLIDQQGTIRQTVFGVLHEADLQSSVEALLGSGSSAE